MVRMVTSLERLRIEASLSRAQLAERAGVSESTVVRIERGGGYEPGVFAMARLAGVLGVRVDDLIHTDEGSPGSGGRGKSVGGEAVVGRGRLAPARSGG